LSSEAVAVAQMVEMSEAEVAEVAINMIQPM
jgi:hypothetical protein